jgi:hypothetical protein
MGESRDLFKGGEDALRVLIFGVGQEFNVIRLDGQPRLSNEVLVDCVEPPCKEYGFHCGIIELGIAVLVRLVEICCCALDCYNQNKWVIQDAFEGCDP